MFVVQSLYLYKQIKSMANKINLTKLKASLPKGLVSRIAKDENISKDKIYNALNGRAAGIEALELLELIIQRRDEFFELVEKLRRSTDGPNL